MDSKEDERINEGLIHGSVIGDIDANFYRVSRSVCKIITEVQTGSGFFLKYSIDNKYFYCLMTNEHIITNDLIKYKKKITVYYDNEFKNININLNKEERYIQNFQEIDENLDIAVVQILPKDNIHKNYFLLPELEINNFDELKTRDIYIPQYFLGENLTTSSGKIKGINNNEFTHLASTTKGSSGSPILLKGSINVFGIHKQGTSNGQHNYGNFIYPALDKIKEYLQNKNKTGSNLKKSIIKIEYDNGEYYIGDLINDIPNGKGIMYYSNNTIKYEGDFKKGKFEGNGKLIFEDGQSYVGEFLDGIKSGKGTEYYKNGTVKYEGSFINDKYEGEGKLIWENGEFYIGKFKDGAMDGKGIEYYKDGNIKYDGNFIKGVYDGDGKYIYKNGNYYIGEWKEGKKHGKGIKFDKDGNVILEGKFITGNFIDND